MLVWRFWYDLPDYLIERPSQSAPPPAAYWCLRAPLPILGLFIKNAFIYLFFYGCAFKGNSACNDQYQPTVLLGDQWQAFLRPLTGPSLGDPGSKLISDDQWGLGSQVAYGFRMASGRQPCSRPGLSPRASLWLFLHRDHRPEPRGPGKGGLGGERCERRAHGAAGSSVPMWAWPGACSALPFLDIRGICRVIPYFIEQLFQQWLPCLPRNQILKTRDRLCFIFRTDSGFLKMGLTIWRCPLPAPCPQPTPVTRGSRQPWQWWQGMAICMDNVSVGGWDGGITPSHPLGRGGGHVALPEEEGNSHRRPWAPLWPSLQFTLWTWWYNGPSLFLGGLGGLTRWSEFPGTETLCARKTWSSLVLLPPHAPRRSWQKWFCSGPGLQGTLWKPHCQERRGPWGALGSLFTRSACRFLCHLSHSKRGTRMGR